GSAAFDNDVFHGLCPGKVLKRSNRNRNQQRRRFPSFPDNTSLHLITSQTMNDHFVDQCSQESLFVLLANASLLPQGRQMLPDGLKGRLQLWADGEQRSRRDSACCLSLFCLFEFA